MEFDRVWNRNYPSIKISFVRELHARTDTTPTVSIALKIIATE